MLDKVLEKGTSICSNEYALTFDCKEIEFNVSAGECYAGSFCVTTDEKAHPEGYVFTIDSRMNIKTPEFGEFIKEIQFEYDATGLKEGSVQQGTINIVSNLGEIEIPYTINIISTVLDSQLGEVRNLFHFANLAMTDWQEAVDMFYSDSFERILTGNDAQFLEYYRGLSQFLPDENGDYTIGNESNVDRFLEITKKKTRIKYSCLTKSFEIKDPEEMELKEAKIKKDGWGFVFMEVVSEGDFIILEKDHVEMADFDEDEAAIPFRINTNALYRGINHGKIVISNFFQKIEIPVKVVYGSKLNSSRSTRRDDRARLMKLYIDYRIGGITKIDWAKHSSVIISKMLSESPEDIEARLYQVHLLDVQKRDEDSASHLEFVKTMMDDQVSPELLGYSYYLEYIMNKEDNTRQAIANNLEHLYFQNKDNFRLAWFLLYVKEEYIKNEDERWQMLSYLYYHGCNSPLIFIEALGIMVNNTTVMTRLGDFELAFLTFAMRHDVMTSDIRNKFVYMTSNEVSYSDEIFNMLVYCYEKEPRDETLSEICKMLMKGNCIGISYFKWYEKAVENELRIARLYEYYMMSIDLAFAGRLPKIVLMYFAYRSNLDFERNAFLYANVLRHRPAYQDIYADYLPVIEKFAIEQINHRRINDDLAYIYKTVLGKKLLEEPYASDYAHLLFMHHVTVDNPMIDGVIIVDERLNIEQRYPVYNQAVDVIFLPGKQNILLEDEYGNRYAEKNMYEVKRIIKTEPHIEDVMVAAGLSLYPALYLAENAYNEDAVNERNEAALLYLSECNETTKEYQLQLLMGLVQYYFDKDEIAKLDELMLRIDPADLSVEMREQCIHIIIARGMYDRALDWVVTYGTEYIDDKILVRLCDRVLVRADFEYDPDVLKICERIFAKGKYDETILKYLVLYKRDTTKNLKVLWRAADSFNMDVHALLENMVVQLLYSGSKIGEEGNIFLEYVSGGGNQELQIMFLNQLAYRYFVCQENFDDTAFDRCIYLNQQAEVITDYIKLAFLKRCQNLLMQGKLDEERKALVVLFIKDFVLRHMIFPFFLDFKELWSKLSLYDDRCFIEYRGREDSRVLLHYCVDRGDEKDEEYKRQEMTHLLGGIYVASFILFYGERVRYYITEEGPRSEKLTKASVLEPADTGKLSNDKRYVMVNNISASVELKDDATFEELSCDYMKKMYMVDNLFLPSETIIN